MSSDLIARGMAINALNEIKERIGDLYFQRLTKAEFQSITPENNKVYYVIDDKGNVKQYLGVVELSSGGKPANSMLLTTCIDAKIGNAIKLDEIE